MGRAFRPFALIVLRPEAGLLAAMDVFEAPGLFPAFGLPASLDPGTLPGGLPPHG
ncbi:hypothetical protein AB0H83_51105 [Dactylosporangium sp. NPDC050688]|uniref:hypothetical protein n=1 Tax=Dactylosporangium sp. NPDC050688 TaxID=3157217 RepID=UPI003403BF81